jgi:hypothetical protein
MKEKSKKHFSVLRNISWKCIKIHRRGSSTRSCGSSDVSKGEASKNLCCTLIFDVCCGYVPFKWSKNSPLCQLENSLHVLCTHKILRQFFLSRGWKLFWIIMEGFTSKKLYSKHKRVCIWKFTIFAAFMVFNIFCCFISFD